MPRDKHQIVTSARNQVSCSLGACHLHCRRLAGEGDYCTSAEKPDFFPASREPFPR